MKKTIIISFVLSMVLLATYVMYDYYTPIPQIQSINNSSLVDEAKVSGTREPANVLEDGATPPSDNNRVEIKLPFMIAEVAFNEDIPWETVAKLLTILLGTVLGVKLINKYID